MTTTLEVARDDLEEALLQEFDGGVRFHDSTLDAILEAAKQGPYLVEALLAARNFQPSVYEQVRAGAAADLIEAFAVGANHRLDPDSAKRIVDWFCWDDGATWGFSKYVAEEVS